MRGLTLMHTVAGTAADLPLPLREVGLAEAPFAEQPVDAIAQARLGTLDHLA